MTASVSSVGMLRLAARVAARGCGGRRCVGRVGRARTCAQSARSPWPRAPPLSESPVPQRNAVARERARHGACLNVGASSRKSSTWSVPRRRSVTTVSPMSLATLTRHSFSASPPCPWPARAEVAWSPQRERRLRGDGRPACMHACLPAACLAGLEAGWLAGWLGSASQTRVVRAERRRRDGLRTRRVICCAGPPSARPQPAWTRSRPLRPVICDQATTRPCDEIDFEVAPGD